ncbi:MAG: class I SAM-dependent methyltransferase, partial [Actinomycetia bacterium]|nr:class I SAM-dependent methyltransferase [Actinomycetes bacterium]
LRLHVQDSVLGLPSVTDAVQGPLLDMGSGPGYPGVVLGVLTGRRVVLVDSVRKKADFLSSVLQALELEGEAIWSRVEELDDRFRHSAAIVTARGVSQLASLVELSAPLLVNRGTLVAYKARVSSEEIERAIGAAGLCGLELAERRPGALPSGEVREIVTFTKTGEPVIELPRRVGVAQRRPLG